MKDKELKREEIETFQTLGETGEDVSSGEGSGEVYQHFFFKSDLF
jgi:hypothetical protein